MSKNLIMQPVSYLNFLTFNGNQKSRNIRFGFLSVLKTGLEPVRPKGHWILSPTCLPIPPLQHLGMFKKVSERKPRFELATPTLAR